MYLSKMDQINPVALQFQTWHDVMDAKAKGGDVEPAPWHGLMLQSGIALQAAVVPQRLSLGEVIKNRLIKTEAIQNSINKDCVHIRNGVVRSALFFRIS